MVPGRTSLCRPAVFGPQQLSDALQLEITHSSNTGVSACLFPSGSSKLILVISGHIGNTLDQRDSLVM